MNKEWITYQLGQYQKVHQHWFKYVEAILVVVLMCWVGYWYNGQSMVLNYSFPVAAIVLFTLTLFSGFIVGLLALGAWLLFYCLYLITPLMPSVMLRSYIAYLLTCVFIAGFFHAYWYRRIEKEFYLRKYVRSHLDGLTQDYYLLRLSHERLEQQYMTKSMSFREGVLILKRDYFLNGGTLTETLGNDFLSLLSQYSTISEAMLFIRASPDEAFKALSRIGVPFDLDMDDVLIKHTMRHKESFYVGVSTLSEHEKSKYLAVIPVLSRVRDIEGLLVIKDMPFSSLGEDTLLAFNVFATCFFMNQDRLSRLANFVENSENYNPQFLLEMDELIYLKKYHGINSVMTLLRIPKMDEQSLLLYGLEKQKRELDHFMIIDEGDTKIVIMLLSLTDSEGLWGFRQRLTSWVSREFGKHVWSGLTFRYRLLTDEPATVQLAAFVQDIAMDATDYAQSQ